jgi:hypothetical protein
MTIIPTHNSRPAAYVATGGLCGLTWAAALRGWMVQLVRAEEPTFSWLTIVLVLLPGGSTGEGWYSTTVGDRHA